MSREIEEHYGCFRCGAIRPIVDINPDTGKYHCGQCGEASIVTMRQALDMLNNYYITYKKDCIDSMSYDEYYPDLVEDNDQ